MEAHLNTVQAAEWLGMSANTLRDWRSREIGPPYIVISPRCIRYAIEDLEKYVAERRRIPSVQAVVEETIHNAALRAKAKPSSPAPYRPAPYRRNR
jgi:Helix-turn-helix domain